MRHRLCLLPLSLLALAACTDTAPTDKAVRYDLASGTLVHPDCPDWSQPSTANYDNSLHSNYGCAVNRNLAIQLESPADLHRGRGAGRADTEETIRNVTRYREGDLPGELTPQQQSEL